MNHRRRRTADLVRGLGALTVLAMLLVGAPVTLYVVAGSPIPDALPTEEQIIAALMRPDDGSLLLGVVKLISWAAWSLFAVTTVAEMLGHLTRRPAPGFPLPIRPMQRLARDLIAMVALIFTTTAPIANAATTPPTTQTVTTSSDLLRSGSTTSNSSSPLAPPTAPDSHVHASADSPPQHARESRRMRFVKAGDTLWDIARGEYGSGKLYLKIFNASKRLRQPAGLPRLTDPDVIFPGQRISIPHLVNGPHHSAPGEPGRSPQGQPASESTADAPLATPEPSQRMPISPQPPTGHATAHRPGAAHPSHIPSRTAPPAPSEERHRSAPLTVSLPTGAFAGIGLAAAISVALATARLHRRRRAAARFPTSPDPQPSTPEPVAALHKAHLDSYAARGEPIPSDADLVTADLATPAPTQLTVGVKDDHELTLHLAGLNVGLSGPGALDVARAITTELLANAHRYRVELLIPEPDLTILLAGTGINPTELADAVPGLTVTDSLSAAITHLETEVIHRARLMEATGELGVPALRTAEPDEPLPAIIVIATGPRHSTDPLEAILQLGHPFGVGGLFLGDCPGSSTACIGGDGTVINTNGSMTAAWLNARLFHIGATDASGILATIRTARGAPDPAPADPATTDKPQHGAVDLHPRTQPEPMPNDRLDNSTARPQPSPAGSYGSESAPVQLQLLGCYRLHAAGQPIETGLRRISRDLLAYLALHHPDGITREQGVDALWPDRDLDSGTTMFKTAINNIRKTLRTATRLNEPMFVIHTQGRYRLDTNLIDVDLWRLLNALNHARSANADPDRIQALTPIADLYTGDLATDLTHEWAETHREELRRHAIDALAHLAQLTQAGDPEHALTTLEHAINHDPYAEPIYRNVMRLQARLERPDAARRTYELLKNRLADLDAEPAEQTHQLLLGLLRPPSPSRTS